MSIQKVFDNASSIQIDKRRLAGHTLSRSGRLKTLSVASAVPWQFKVRLSDGLRYSENREFLNDLDQLDRVFPERINIGQSNFRLDYITKYNNPSGFSEQDLRNMTIVAVGTGVGSGALQFTVDCTQLPTQSRYDVLFEKGDIIQPGGWGTNEDDYLYPYVVTEEVIRGVADNRVIPVHRPFIQMPDVDPVALGYGVRAGVKCNWNLLMIKKPSYTVLPYDRIGWDGEFEFIEVIE